MSVMHQKVPNYGFQISLYIRKYKIMVYKLV